MSLANLPPMRDPGHSCDGKGGDAPERVLTDDALLRHIFSFQSGIPMPLFLFWLDHNPSAKPTQRDAKPPVISSLWSTEGIRSLINVVIKHGTLGLLQLVPKICGWLPPTKSRSYKKQSGRSATVVLGESTMQQIIGHNRVDMLRWAIANGVLGDNLCRLWRNAIKQYRQGDLRVLDVLLGASEDPKTELGLSSLTPEAVSDPKLFEWLHEHAPDAIVARQMIYVAVDRGDLVMVRHLCEKHGDDLFDSRLFKQALNRDYREVMEYLLENRPDLARLEDVELALQRRAITTVGLMRGNLGYAIVVKALATRELAASDGKMEVLSHLCKCEMLPSSARILIDTLAGSGRLDLIRMLHAQGVAVATTEAMKAAAEKDHWDVVQYLTAHHYEDWGDK